MENRARAMDPEEKIRSMSLDDGSECGSSVMDTDVDLVSSPRLESAVEESFEEARGGQWHSEEGATAEEGVEDQSATDEYASAAEEEEDDEDDPRRGHLEILAQRLDAMRRAGQLPPHLMEPDEPPRPPLLASFDEAGVGAYLASILEVSDSEDLDSGRDIVVLGGAGMSTSAGIPDFRSAGTGLYDNLQKYDLPRPQAIFEIDYFKERPDAFYELAGELWPGTFCPTPTHLFIKLLHDKGRLLRCFTQNIDSLESAAGIPKDRVVAAHGNFDSATCVEDGKKVCVEELRRAVQLGENGGWRGLRERHGGLVKPDIVFFGEGLPRRFFELASRDLPRAKLLLVVGTSLSVQPFASLIDHVGEDCVRVLVNRDAVGTRDRRIPRCVAEQLGLGRGFEFEAASNWRDVALLGDCDERIFALAEALGWRADLERLVATARAHHAAQHPHQASGDHDDDDDARVDAPPPHKPPNAFQTHALPNQPENALPHSTPQEPAASLTSQPALPTLPPRDEEQEVFPHSPPHAPPARSTSMGASAMGASLEAMALGRAASTPDLDTSNFFPSWRGRNEPTQTLAHKPPLREPRT